MALDASFPMHTELQPMPRGRGGHQGLLTPTEAFHLYRLSTNPEAHGDPHTGKHVHCVLQWGRGNKGWTAYTALGHTKSTPKPVTPVPCRPL